MESPNNPNVEVTAALLRGAVSAIPLVGGIISEVGNLYLNPLEKRKKEWFDQVCRAIEEINERFNRLPESLESDEAFLSVLYQATILALKNHQKEKIDALRNAIVSAAGNTTVHEDKQLMFLGFIDDLTVTHLKLMVAIDKHSGQISRLEKLESVFSKIIALTRIEIDRIMFRSVIQDLDSKLLIRMGDLEDLPEYASKITAIITENSSKRSLGITSLGREFLDFVRGAER